MEQGRRVAFDYGDVRIGVAASDRSGILASPYMTLMAGSEELDADLKALFDELDPIYIAIGMPKNLSGSGSAKIDSVMTFAHRIRAITTVKIYLIDERLTTVSAARTLKDSGRSTREARSEIDAMAATTILESALNNERLQGVPSREVFP
jgi:putative Holliday junction resolvase